MSRTTAIPALPRIFAMTDTTERPGRQRRFWFAILGVVVLIGAVAYGVYWLLYSRYFESTDDAYVAGNVVTITSKENATVLVLHADNTQSVKHGQLLVEMGPGRRDGESAGIGSQLGARGAQRAGAILPHRCQ